MHIKDESDVWQSPFLNKFKDVAKYFGLEAEYISVPTPPDIAGLYLGLYADKKCLKNPDINTVRKFAEENRRESGLNLNGRVLRLDGFDDFVTHEQAMTYLQNVEVIRRAYSQNGVVPPAKISDEAALYIRSFYTNSVNFALPQYKRAAYTEQLKLILQNTLKCYDPKTDKVIREDIDTGLTAKQNAHRPKDGRNNVTTDHLIRSAGRVESIYVRAKYRDDIIEALNKTDYLYSISPVIGEGNAEFADNELFGSKENNDTRRFVLSYDANYTNEVRSIYERIIYPQLFHMPYKDFERIYSPLGRIQVLDETLGNFIQKCVNARVPFVFDIHGDTSYSASLPIAYPSRFQTRMDCILRDISAESEAKKLAKDGLLSEKDLITEDDLFKGGLVEIPPEDAHRVRICGKTIEELAKNAEEIEL